jgi:hypothetical protein
MRTFLKTTRESDCVIKSLLSFFARFWGSFSLFFLYLSLFVVARARALCLSLSLLLSPTTTHQGGEEDLAMLSTMMMKICEDF